MAILLTLLIVVLGGAAVFLLHLSKSGEAWAKPAAVCCSALVIILAVIRTISLGSAPTVGELMDLNEEYKTLCGEVVAVSLAERHPGARVVVFTAPIEHTGASRAMEERLQTTLEERGLTVTLQPIEITERDLAELNLPNDAGLTREDMVTMLMHSPGWFDAGDLRQALAEVKNSADLLVCLYDQPFSLDGINLPRKGSGPGLVVVNAEVRDPQPLLDKTVLDTIVMHRKEYIPWAPGAKRAKKTQDAFDQRYVLITAGRATN